MAKSINLAKYPTGMMDVVEAVCETGRECVIPYPDEKTAKRERFQFYGLVRAIKITGHSLAPKVSRLVFSLSGPSKNILKIQMVESTDSTDFYSRVAESHLSGSQQ